MNRNPNIDLLRGIAIFTVLLLHHALSYGFRGSTIAEILPKAWLHNLVINGGYGVTMFFTISGFLITSIALRRYMLSDVTLRWSVSMYGIFTA